MLLGKRPRPPMMTTTTTKASFSEGLPVASDAPSPCFPPRLDGDIDVAPGKNNPRRVAITHLHCSHFLKACGLCKTRLGPGKDTFMYRGDMAFCSLECRQKQISMDEGSNKAA